MKAPFGLVGVFGLAIALVGVSPVSAQHGNRPRVASIWADRLPDRVICHPTRIVRIVPSQPNPYLVQAQMAAIAYRQAALMAYQQQWQPQYFQPLPQTASPSASDYQPSANSSPHQMNSPSSTPAARKTNSEPQAPSGPVARMSYVGLTVKGVQSAADSDKLILALDKMKGSRGASVKRRDNGEAAVKVWFSDLEPLESKDVIDVVHKAGFIAVLAGS